MVPGAGSSASAACVAVNNCFSPNPINVAPGTTVTWRNTDTVSHYVSSGKSTDATTGTIFDSGNLIKPGGTYQFTFANAGTFNYFCTVHPWMIGEVIVGGAAAGPTAPGNQTGIPLGPPYVAPSNPSITPMITVTTDKPAYDHNSQIMITGHVVNPFPGQGVGLVIISPSGNVVTEAQIALDSNGDFTTTEITAGGLWLENGQYTVKVQFGSNANAAQTTFQLIGEATPPTGPLITLSTDKTSYALGDTIVISGSVQSVVFGTPLTIQILDPANNLVSVVQVGVSQNGAYTDTIQITGSLWKLSGTYTVKAQYGPSNISAQTTFQFTGQATSNPTPSPYQQFQHHQFQPNSFTEIDMAPGAGSSASAACVAANNCYSPNPAYVTSGTTVTWKNTDTVSHYVTSGHPTDNRTGTIFDSGNLIKPQGSYQFTFTTPGTYNYFCTVHPWMIGQVIVGQGGPYGHQPGQFFRGNMTGEQFPRGPQPMPSQLPPSVFMPSQQDMQSINEAKASQTIAAEVNVGAGQSTTTSIDNNVTVQTTSNTADSLNVNVSAPSQTGPKVIAFNLNTTTVNVANLNNLGVMYDGKLIPPAANVDDILHAKSTDNPSFAIVVTQSGVQILVLVPHFSTHTITIMNMSQIMAPTVPEFPFAAVILVIAIFSIVIISRMNQSKYYSL